MKNKPKKTFLLKHCVLLYKIERPVCCTPTSLCSTPLFSLLTLQFAARTAGVPMTIR